jgi:uncharacterized protein (DUF488 family)
MERKIDQLVYTIGHSNHSIEYFIELLKTYSITCVIDVRSVPASSYNPQFNMENLQHSLKANNITWLHFGEEFGARHTEKELLDAFGKVDFDKVRNTPKFLSGVDRLVKGLEKGFRIALMCSEAEPFDCHRFSMISYYLVRNGFVVHHILKDKTFVTNEELEKRLLKKYERQIPATTLFEIFSEDDQLNLAYRLRNKDVAYD